MALAGCVTVIEDIHEYSGPMIIAVTAENAMNTRNNFLIETVSIYYGTPDGNVFWLVGDPFCGEELDGKDFS
jgi:hypothetical protein